MILIIILILGFTACFISEDNIIRTTKQIKLFDFYENENFQVKNIKDLAAFSIAVFEIGIWGNKVTITEV